VSIHEVHRRDLDGFVATEECLAPSWHLGLAERKSSHGIDKTRAVVRGQWHSGRNRPLRMARVMPKDGTMRYRPRRNRKHPAIRAFCQETSLAPRHLVHPLFLHEAKTSFPIPSMPGCFRLDIDGAERVMESSLERGIHCFAFFPALPLEKKSSDAAEAYNPEGLVPKALRALKRRFPEAVLITDVALDPYSSDGHDGLVSQDGRILNDETVEVLVQQALCQAEAGADIVAPSDMMDGRVEAIRDALDDHDHPNVSILAYCAKYASAFYGPFRDALESAPRFGDKRSYQMDPANAREALREMVLDEDEGADMLMVKPALPYLDVIRMLRDQSNLPIVAYQVSGEYAMLKAAAQNGWLDERKAALEALLSIRRAGADLIFSYYAPEAAEWIKGGLPV
jgi:porphobilinogen synthase